MGKYVENIKVAENLPISSLTTMSVKYLIMLHVDGNVDKKVSAIYHSDGQTDI